MTNEQLAILLDGIQSELNDALLEARMQLAADRPKQKHREHVAGRMCPNLFTKCENPEHWEWVEVDDPVIELAAIDAVLERLGGRVDLLRPPPR